jgi:hypothetical protein
MYDAVIFAEHPEPAARTLACLVEGAVDGVLNHMLIVSPPRSDDLATLADEAGCRLEMGVDAAAMPAALERHLVTPHALAFAEGALPGPGWPQRLRDEFRRRGQPEREMIVAFRPERRREAWKLIAAISIKGRVPLGYGALVPRPLLIHRLKGGTVRSHGPMHLTEMTVGRV